MPAPVIRKNSIRTEHFCNQQLSKPRTKLRLEAIQNVTMLHRAEKAAARSFCGAQEWTGADRLRHSKFVALRDDKNPRTVVKET
jgi:hypothetical protein